MFYKNNDEKNKQQIWTNKAEERIGECHRKEAKDFFQTNEYSLQGLPL